ncbi:MAG: hypothetical protein U5J62_01410 [Desulfurivibrio sp.]|nr:hypothetical protein [Desulfurivibrio sp.]
MKWRKLVIATLGVAALGALGSGVAMAQEDAFADAGEVAEFSRPWLSRLWSDSDSANGTLFTSPARPSRFSLGYFTTDTTQESARRHKQPLANRQSTFAALATEAYYGAARLDLSWLAETNYQPPWLQGSDGRALSLEAGVSRDDLSAGLLYAYQSGYVPFAGEGQSASYPMYFFTPTDDGASAFDQRSSDNHAVFLYLGYNLSQQLNLRGSMGLAQTELGGDEQSLRLGESSRRWGVDVAATYRLLDNLVYEAHLGYVNIDETTASQLDDNSAVSHAGGSAPSSLYQIGSHIRMTF